MYARKRKPDVKAYNQAFEARQKDSKATLSPNENTAWITVGAVVAKAESEIVVVNEKYKKKVEKLLEQRDRIVEVAEKEIKRREQGKGLYDSEEEKDKESVKSLELDPKDVLLDPTSTGSEVRGAESNSVERLFNGLTQGQVAQYSEQTAELEELAFKLGAYTANYTAEREIHPRDSYERAKFDRLVSKFVVYSNIVQSRLNSLRRIIEGERLTLEQKEYTDYSDGGYSEPNEINEDFSKLKIRKRRRRIPIPRKEEFKDSDEEQEKEQVQVEKELRQPSEHESEEELKF